MRNFELTFNWTFAEKLPPDSSGILPPANILRRDHTAISFSDVLRWNELSSLMDHWCSQVMPIATRIIYEAFQALAAEAGSTAARDKSEPWERGSKGDESLLKAPEPPATKATKPDIFGDIRVVQFTRSENPPPMPEGVHEIKLGPEPVDQETEKSNA